MEVTKRKARALGLCSGGLDSRLAAKILQMQGIDVYLITFETPFFSAQKAREAAKQLGLPLEVANITDIYLTMLRNPPCGYGKHMNPCLDCHALMFRLAGETMRKKGFDFLFSGEVLGQRPMSQTRSSLRYVEKHSGYDGYILRPLSALQLGETIPEKEGWVDRSRLLGITGRGRKDQMVLAEQFEITDYPSPAGGCLLTDKGYADRLRDLFAHQETTSESELHLLKYGRHFRLESGAKIIVGRTKPENEALETYADPAKDTRLWLHKKPGPVCLVTAGADETTVKLAASLCVGYSKTPQEIPTEVRVKAPDKETRIQVLGMAPDLFKAFLL
ncbi:MAG: tRNA 4-thiouridine(8) synthase ThiI [Desulfobacterales bacterium]|jgi:tRNA U34 2-thiouridine synthase MnmA/TrmU|nr:tRNA 4-thiouridine(8) synthase ThiI [Desulfobacterales bacterium]